MTPAWKKFLQLNGVTEQVAKQLDAICSEHYRGRIEVAMNKASKLLEAHGTEVFRDDRLWRDYWADVRYIYINMGDPYINTIVYDISRGCYRVTDIGTLIERCNQNHIK